MDIDFTNIEYLEKGNPKQQRAYMVLTAGGIMEMLQPYGPILVGTVPIGIDVGDSDLDIVCQYRDKEMFKAFLWNHFSHFPDFGMGEYSAQEQIAILAGFRIQEFQVELFAQPIPGREQYAYRHMIIEDRLLRENGEDFRQQVIALKEEGLKTEAAFCRLLNLEGDPFEALLDLE